MRTIKDKPGKGSIELLIESKSHEDKERIKCEELSKVNHPKKFTFNGIEISIDKKPAVSNGFLEVTVSAKRDGKDLFIDNPLIFKNPPVSVPDGTYRIEKNIDDEDREVANYIENPLEALKLIVGQTVELVGR